MNLKNIYRNYKKILAKTENKLFGTDIFFDNDKWPEGKPLVSVIIPCFNYGKYIDDALESLFVQTFNNYEIIVVDGGSNEQETIKKLKSISLPRVTVYFREGRHLVGDNRNFGIARAQGKFICCLDADDKLCSTYLEKALFYAETYNFDIVYPWVQSFGNRDEVWAPWATDFSSCLKGANLSTVALFKREAWERVGGFRDWGLGKEHVPEDWDFWTRLLGHGFRAKMLPEPLMLYRVHGEGLTAQNRMNLRNQREKIVSSNRELFSRDYKILRRQQRRVEYLVNNPFINLMGENREKTNVLLTLPFMVTGGADEVLLRILGHLSRKNFAFSCITTLPTDAKISGDNSPRYEKITPEIYHLHKFLHEKRETRDFIFYLIETKRIDIIFIVGCSFVYQMIPEIKNRYPHVKIVDQLFNPFGHIINNRRFAKSIDLNIVANDGIEKILVNRLREKKEKVKVIIHGVDVTNEFCPEQFREAYPRNPSWKLRPDDFVVGFFGRFSKEKCPVKFVDIAARLKELAGVTWVMTGGGDEFMRVRARIVSHGLEKSLLTPGIVPDVKPFLAATHVVVIPSLIEGIPIVLMEAMALGIPVVASRVGGIPDVITDGHNGFLCAPSDIDAFAARIKLLHEDRNLWESMGKNAREYALNHLDVRKMLEEYHQEFMNVKNQCLGGGYEA